MGLAITLQVDVKGHILILQRDIEKMPWVCCLRFVV